MDIVSVPYRGYSFFNGKHCIFGMDKNIPKVSVPYRGYSFFNLIIGNAIDVDLLCEFPSLTGVIHFLISVFTIKEEKITVLVSVPYRGYSFFNSRFR